MKSKQKMEKKSIHVYYLSLIVLLAVVALVVILNQRSVVVDEDGNIVGEAGALRINKGRAPAVPIRIARGGACGYDAQCASSLICGRGQNGQVCERPNSNSHGDYCVLDRECTASSPRCASESGGDSRCANLYTQNQNALNCWCDSLALVGSRCEANNDCSSGLVCIRASGASVDTCQNPAPPVTGLNQGETCQEHSQCSSGLCVRSSLGSAKVCTQRFQVEDSCFCESNLQCYTQHCHSDQTDSSGNAYGLCGLPEERQYSACPS